MTTRRNASTPLLGAVAAAMLLVAGAVSAQTIARPDQLAAATKPAQPVKPVQLAKPAKPAAAPAKAAEQGTDYWAINTDLGRYRDERPLPPANDASRIRLQGAPGSVGLTSEAAKTGEFATGRAAPGLERYNQDSSSYAGVSMSLTNSNKSFPLPTQLLPHNQW
jgi:hypothetical protein